MRLPSKFWGDVAERAKQGYNGFFVPFEPRMPKNFQHRGLFVCALFMAVAGLFSFAVVYFASQTSFDITRIDDVSQLKNADCLNAIHYNQHYSGDLATSLSTAGGSVMERLANAFAATVPNVTFAEESGLVIWTASLARHVSIDLTAGSITEREPYATVFRNDANNSDFSKSYTSAPFRPMYYETVTVHLNQENLLYDYQAYVFDNHILLLRLLSARVMFYAEYSNSECQAELSTAQWNATDLPVEDRIFSTKCSFTTTLTTAFTQSFLQLETSNCPSNCTSSFGVFYLQTGDQGPFMSPQAFRSIQSIIMPEVGTQLDKQELPILCQRTVHPSGFTVLSLAISVTGLVVAVCRSLVYPTTEFLLSRSYPGCCCGRRTPEASESPHQTQLSPRGDSVESIAESAA